MKKVLIITYYWPPSGGIAVHRCLKFAKYLPEFGWEPIVYAPENAQYPVLDPSNLEQVPQGLTIIKKPIIELFGLYKKLSGKSDADAASGNPLQVRNEKYNLVDEFAVWFRGNFFIPDARALWVKPSVRFLTSYLENNKVDAILSDGPPHTNTWIACNVSKKTGIPWLADFQDPWTQVDYYKLLKLTRRDDKKHKSMEQEAFRVAKKITIASPSWKKDLESIGAGNVEIIYWGYDEADFKNLPAIPVNKDGFIISHAGLLGYDRKPDGFFRALADLVSENPSFAEKLRIILAGSVDYSVRESMNDFGLEKHSSFLGNIKRADAINLSLKSQLLILPLNKADNAKGRIPGKLFEYLRAEVPVICFGPEGSDVENILNSTKRGKSFAYDDYPGIKDYISEVFTKYQAGTKSIVNPMDISTYDVRNQTGKVARYLDEISQNVNE